MRNKGLIALHESDEEVLTLIETISRAGQRLEEVTKGQVDTVIDPDGRTLLLRGTQEQLRSAEAARHRLILNALPAPIALLDANGVIVSANDAWLKCEEMNYMKGPGGLVGHSYLDICDAMAPDAFGPNGVADGTRAVLHGGAESFSLEYSCQRDSRESSFLLTVTPLTNDRRSGAVVMHLDITERKQAQDDARDSERRLVTAAEILTRNAELETRVTERTQSLVEQAVTLARQGALLNLAQDAIVVCGTDSRILFWNRGAENMYGWSSGYAIGKISHTLLRSEPVLPVEQIMSELFETGYWEGEATYLTRAQGRITVGVRWALQRDANGVPVKILTIANDISKHKRAESKLRALSERLALATSVAKVGVWDWDLPSNSITWDDTMFQIYGFENVLPVPYEKWSAAVDPRDLPAVESTLQRVIREKADGSAEFRITNTAGAVRNIFAVERPVMDSNSTVVRVIGVNMDITDRKVAETALQTSEAHFTHSAQHDFLTGLPNRMLLNDRVSRAITSAPRNGKKVALLFLDLDGFKHINDSLGHSIGDRLLQSITRRLADCVRASDTVSRQGGDEFIVLLSELAHSEDAAITARRMLTAVAETHSIDDHELHVTASIGLSIYPDDGRDAETLIQNADTAMYQAKENGRHSYQFFKAEMNARAVERQSTEESLRRALDRGEFELHYQPKVDLNSGKITGAEALIRWQHPTRGLLSPAQFIPVAEDSGLIVPIGKWCLREACQQARKWAEMGFHVRTIAVNISTVQLRDDDFLEDVFDALEKTGLDAKFLELELTESVLMKRAESAAEVLQKLKAKGVQIALDDFGTGYSSLSYLRKFPIDVLKIDQSFIRQIMSGPAGTSIVSAVISLGHSLGIRVVAEGVESREELSFLRAQRCDEAQGYYFGRPVPADQFIRLFSSGFRQKGDTPKS
jgi:diguanylate cyclase (GGDEF)-like protein/PAS domain S-box-containing protein